MTFDKIYQYFIGTWKIIFLRIIWIRIKNVWLYYLKSIRFETLKKMKEKLEKKN